MNVLFRVDASATIGYGHVMRCLTLAEALRERGHSSVFVCRKHPGHLCDTIGDRGFAVARLGAAPDHHEDSAQTAAMINSGAVHADWLVTDHYGISGEWHSALRGSVGHILAIDDLANRSLDCDVLLDQNLVAGMSTRYVGKVPAACRLLIGPQYALLQREYAELHMQARPRTGPVRRVLIFFSGADPGNLTGRTVAAFLRLERRDVHVDVVVAASNAHADAVRAITASHPNIHLHVSLPTLAPLMVAADLAVGGSGATSWERLCLALPALVVTMADNQREVAAELHERRLIRWLGDSNQVDDAAIEQELRGALTADAPALDMADVWQMVDGRGANRVVEMMVGMSAALTTES